VQGLVGHPASASISSNGSGGVSPPNASAPSPKADSFKQAASGQQQQHQHQHQPVSVPAEAKHAKQQPDYELVDTSAALNAMLEQLRHVKCIGLDCEGLKLGDKEEGKLSLMQISALGSKGGSGAQQPLRIWLVDVAVLAWRCIHYRTSDKAVNLKALLEDGSITKLMFDVRSDSTQLSKEYGVRLRGVYDLQLAEVAHRQLQLIPTAYLLPLTKTLEKYVKRLPTFEKDMLNSQDVARTYHYSNKTEIWEQRPLAAELQEYAACDVRYLHALADALNKKLPKEIVTMVQRATMQRIMVPSPPGMERAAAPTIVKRSDVRRLLRPRSQQSTQKQQQQGGRGSAPSRPPLLVLAEIRTQLATRQQALSSTPAASAAIPIEEQQQQHEGGITSLLSVVDSLERALQQQQNQESKQQGQPQQQPRREFLRRKQQQMSRQAERRVSGGLEEGLSALLTAELLPEQQQQQQQIQRAMTVLQGVLRGLHGAAEEGDVSATEATDSEEEVQARAPPPLLLPVQEEGHGSAAVGPGEESEMGTSFLLKPRKRQPGEPEPSWLLQASSSEREGSSSEGSSKDGNSGSSSSSNQSCGEIANVQGSGSEQESPASEAHTAGVQGSGEAAAGQGQASSIYNNSSGSRPTASPFLLWAPAALEKRKQEASQAAHTIVKRPMRKPPGP